MEKQTEKLQTQYLSQVFLQLPTEPVWQEQLGSETQIPQWFWTGQLNQNGLPSRGIDKASLQIVLNRMGVTATLNQLNNQIIKTPNGSLARDVLVQRKALFQSVGRKMAYSVLDLCQAICYNLTKKGMGIMKDANLDYVDEVKKIVANGQGSINVQSSDYQPESIMTMMIELHAKILKSCNIVLTSQDPNSSINAILNKEVLKRNLKYLENQGN